MAKYTADEVADAIIAFGLDHGDSVTNLRLQRLLYYAQGWHLALHGEPAFDDRIEAWLNGPVVPDVYRKYLLFKHNLLDTPTTEADLTPDLREHVRDIWDAYGHLSSYHLERMSTAEPPWRNARGSLSDGEACENPLSLTDMKDFFASELAHNNG
jgi:uncharacterized phage-associated protein